jgi:hypothetical protein
MMGKATRKAISKGARFAVFRRDGFTCRYCGRKPPEVMLHIDHIVPVAKGGDNAEANLITACVSCNLGKSDGDVQAPPAIDQTVLLEGMQEAMERASLHRASVAVLRDSMDAESEVIEEFAWRFRANGQPIGYMETSLRFFLRRGLPAEDLLALADSVSSKVESRYVKPRDAFRYLCGAAWASIRDMEAGAA